MSICADIATSTFLLATSIQHCSTCHSIAHVYLCMVSFCRHLKLFLISFALAWIQQQKKVTLDAKYKLPKMHYKGERVTSQIMRMDKQLVKDMGDVVEDPEFPLMTKQRHVTVPRAPKEFTKVRDDTAQTARLASPQQAGADMSASHTSRASTASMLSPHPASSQGQSQAHGF